MADMVRLSRKTIHILAVAVILAASTAAPSTASTADGAITDDTIVTSEPVRIIADEVIHDRELATITARGKIELSQGERLLFADQVTFDQGRNMVIAAGNVALLDPGGDVLTAEYLELNGTLKDGFILNLQAMLADGSRLAARRLTRKAGQSKVMDYGVYSPCNLCPDKPDRPPLWQIKALTVIHDETAKDLIYKDAWLELWGTPIAYVPFFFHPDPSVDRRTGLLPPRLGQTQQLGSIVGTPYYWAIAPDRDLQIEPIV
jgi:LPS-assembly protein